MPHRLATSGKTTEERDERAVRGGSRHVEEAGDGVKHALEQHGSLVGENLSDRGRLADGAFKNTVGTTFNTGVYAAGSGIESDLQDLVKDEKDE
ncbi:hypothetical protein [Streptomyces sp. MBT33]|uniref:hypothetical protein n=1 Tax=Streptomyces sp. MBT33 TaxID=1488363 RepID=UPI001F434115|nr:hypothetical protein [Streptomyces sp. MBT33]